MILYFSLSIFPPTIFRVVDMLSNICSLLRKRKLAMRNATNLRDWPSISMIASNQGSMQNFLIQKINEISDDKNNL